MGYKVMELKAQVINMPEYEPQRYIVARLVNSQLWYYGSFRTPSQAAEVANQLGGNSLVLKYEREDEDDRR